jgi:hypothetical protein
MESPSAYFELTGGLAIEVGFIWWKQCGLDPDAATPSGCDDVHPTKRKRKVRLALEIISDSQELK